ncbi:uncharacterized protein JN550_008369 [Neoarthrinium moseri]|uniref:uncharacterized protein n=1 Tax=Neoarthrinium moseri TaxID=1658444 RepID=UPI001FDC3CEA|nr:uncharacterized protein JN550_008369 [Neoarthrinium moseri]KAI1865321.1 hypothetical protein JN550_008369 [Neoarthrinium moseri]
MEWHDKSCTRLDLASFGDGTSCLSCGSFGPALDPVRPPIKQLSEIRILCILPGRFQEPVECEITTESLSSHPEYDAISYTWADESGNASASQTILVSGTPFQVTRNCEMALKRVRMQFSTRRVWIDAVCIDQENVDERGHQVGLMPRIYSRAKNVLSYIGEATPESRAITQALLRGQPASHGVWYDIVSRRYFTRLWILQEVALARKAVLVCGEDSVPWEVVRKETSHLRRSPILPPVFFFDYKIYSSPGQLLDLLVLAQSCSATDPRDKVFALLGLLPSGRIGDLEANYNLTVRQIYIQVALHLAEAVGWPRVLVHAGADRQGETVALPTWVPDWNWSKDRPRDRLQETEIPNAGWETVMYNEINNSISLKIIHIQGLRAPWRAWEPSLATLGTHYLCFPRKRKITEVVLQLYDSFCERQDQRCLWNGALLPFGYFVTQGMGLEMHEVKQGQHSLHGFYNYDINWVSQFSCLSITAAAQVFTMVTNNIEQLDILVNAIEAHLVEEDLETAMRNDEVEFDRDAYVPYIKLLTETLPPVGEELEGLWMRKFHSGELGRFENRMNGVVDVDSDSDHTPEPLIQNVSDALWRLLVRCFTMRETTIEII